MELLFEVLFVLIECLFEMMCMGSKGRWVILIIITISALFGFGYFAYTTI